MITPNEQTVLRVLHDVGFIVDADENHPCGTFFIGAGSHGDSDNCLRCAMKKCLNCCGIGKFWKISFGKGRLASEFFPEISLQYLGPWRHKHPRKEP